jgi:hypothetical protein
MAAATAPAPAASAAEALARFVLFRVRLARSAGSDRVVAVVHEEPSFDESEIDRAKRNDLCAGGPCRTLDVHRVVDLFPHGLDALACRESRGWVRGKPDAIFVLELNEYVLLATWPEGLFDDARRDADREQRAADQDDAVVTVSRANAKPRTQTHGARGADDVLRIDRIRQVHGLLAERVEDGLGAVASLRWLARCDEHIARPAPDIRIEPAVSDALGDLRERELDPFRAFGVGGDLDLVAGGFGPLDAGCEVAHLPKGITPAS